MSGGLSKGRSRSDSSSQQSTFVDPQQAPFLQQLYSRGLGTLNQSGGIGQAANASLSGLLPQAQGNLDALGGIAGGSNPFIQNLLQRATGQNPELQNQINAGAQDITRNFSENILPAIGSQFGLAGVRGGSGQQISQGIAGGRAAEAIGDLSSNLRFGDYFAGQQAAAQGAGLQSQAAGQGIAGAQDVFNLGLGGFSAPFLPLSLYAGLLGGPTVLGQGSSISSGDSGSFGISIPG